ncbi:MAG: uroporphyrinogen-III C-methyltransferase [Oceanospirillaceae bacterium]|uniref:uroporphyrinogen-III C-methyltransferase n=1 Tax=unclassified Thalassolituus TaxID=2624967 RepID=UPI000C50BD37|nr:MULTISPECIES: uroporphyrinogen-III C-methyltransferase [unclassified Thalassolituus]MAS25108.1 uroporphyrinogen-III C-methyltransferase [Oceanospirillaceae bacterium]MAX97974.1 uroporphyrinogen-III C-methyltransferase [Oceanospirillaceae bacterium]MBL34141.1 uroporphyrinogen-III C-methyltransferase [Oceanospirillaceae bacterium]MBS52126.1 uroporphyrinogen-III C-methyltransferase [Oceanospirillaceae bacterium]|tara:strand:- start:2014 stop:2850 length:837 start_codon:yes stop_codon:yes gene_type:complete
MNNHQPLLHNESTSRPAPAEQQSTVWLVGAGPGDPELLTVKAMRIISQAEVVLYDSLISDDILALLPRQCTRIHTGKRCGAHKMSQGEINRTLLTAARKYQCVVRLKGGDPFIFGRGGEELEYLEKHGMDVRIIPGITAAGGCAAAAGIPLTHREYGNALVLHSGHTKFHEFSPCQNPTRVFYMGLRQAGAITAHLLQEGLSTDTPVALITNGTLSNQQVHKGLLIDLPEISAKALTESSGPGLIFVGEVAAMAKSDSKITTNQHNVPTSETHTRSVA